mgnify:CR=1 FL=1
MWGLVFQYYIAGFPKFGVKSYEWRQGIQRGGLFSRDEFRKILGDADGRGLLFLLDRFWVLVRLSCGFRDKWFSPIAEFRKGSFLVHSFFLLIFQKTKLKFSHKNMVSLLWVLHKGSVSRHFRHFFRARVSFFHHFPRSPFRCERARVKKTFFCWFLM